MEKLKKGTSIISITLCLVALVLVTSALVIAKRNDNIYKASLVKTEEHAYVRVYSLDEVKHIARQAYADNYLSFVDGKTTITQFKKDVENEIKKVVPSTQIESFNIYVYEDGVDVQYK